MRKSFLKPAIIFLLFAVSSSVYGQIKGFNKIKWQREKIAPGLLWKSSHAVIEDTVKQNINILVVNTNKRKISILYNPEENIPTSRQASAASALAAVNAGFFSIKDGGSATYLKTNGKIVDSDTAKKWVRVANMNGSVVIDSRGGVSVMKIMTNSWYDSDPNLKDILVTGPLLILDKKKQKLPETSLVINKHPRTCFGIINNHKVILLALDGRTDQSAGMTLMTLSDLMMALKCNNAVNLDGGGSTTMWINGKPFNGIVNMPCDNRKFDHEGERAVSDIFIIK